MKRDPMDTRPIRFAILAGFLAAFPCQAAIAAPSPNIIVIIADDLGCRDLKMYGGWVETPRIEKMASEGMVFSDFHSNSSVCSPARTAFLTGRYQQRAGVVDVIVGDREPDHGIPASMPTIAQVFQKNGYATGLFGKWHCGFQEKYNPVHHGFDEFVGFLNGAADYHQHGTWLNGLQKQDVKGYSTDLITDKSIDFIQRHKDKPFFLCVAHQTPHNPYETRSDTPENRKDGWKKNQVNDENRPRYKQMLKDLDDSVGKILDTVKQAGLAENTLVIFFSDNGDVGMSPVKGPYRGGKFSQFEGGLRVPAVAFWPGKIKAGSKSDAFIIGFDLYPTLTEIAGISGDNPNNLDGTSAKDHILHQKAFPDRDIFFGYEPKLGTAMRRGNWKMIVKGDDVQLYNLKADLKETTNVATEHPEITESMHQAIEKFKQTVVPGS